MNLSIIGNTTIGLAIICSLLQLELPSCFKNEIYATKLAASLTLLQFFFSFLAVITLIYAYVISDFSLVTVALHSHTTKPLIYKIAGVWSNHEGSLLLWICLSTGLAAFFSYKGTNLEKPYYLSTLAHLGGINAAFFLFILLTSNPFFTTGDGPVEGMGMNPLLQDPAMVFHPPFLYLGYVGFSIPFAMMLSFLKLKKDPISLKTISSWVLFAWGTLTIGITLGSYWAYYELGWGGWWFWDPVENASLMPWCLCTALIHSLLITDKTNSLPRWSILLIYFTFIFCILGAFLTRSGIISSVHSFANSPERGHYILMYVSFISVYFLVRFYFYGKHLKSSLSVPLFSREGLMLSGNILLILIIVTLLLGTFYPLLIEVWKGEQVTLAAPFFNLTIVPLVIPLIGLMALAPLLVWGGVIHKSFFYYLQLPLFFCMIGVLLSLFIYKQQHFYSVVFISLSLFLGGSVISTWRRERWRVPFHTYGMKIAHLGFAVAVSGMTVDTYNVQETSQILKLGDEMTLGGFTLKLTAVEEARGPNFNRERATLKIYKDGKLLTHLYPEKRLYRAEKVLMSEVSLKKRWFSEIYAVLGDYQGNNSWVVRAYYHPLVLLIWIGGLMIALGAFIALYKKISLNHHQAC